MLLLNGCKREHPRVALDRGQDAVFIAKFDDACPWLHVLQRCQELLGAFLAKLLIAFVGGKGDQSDRVKLPRSTRGGTGVVTVVVDEQPAASTPEVRTR